MTCANRTNDDDPTTGFCLPLSRTRLPMSSIHHLLLLPSLAFLRDPLYAARVRMLNHKSIDVTHRRGLRYVDLPPRFGLSAFPTTVSSARGCRPDRDYERNNRKPKLSLFDCCASLRRANSERDGLIRYYRAEIFSDV